MEEPGGGPTVEQPKFTTFNTDRLTLSTLSVADAEAMLDLLAQADVMKWTSYAFPITDLELARRWVSDRALGRETFNFAIRLRPTETRTAATSGEKDRIIGVMGSFHRPSIGYLLHPDYTGRGYATEALQALIPRLFDHMPRAKNESSTGFDYVEASTDSENLPSQKLLLKCGFTFCELRERDYESKVMGVRDTKFYRLARPGMDLQALGLIPSEQGREADSDFIPPIQ